MKPTMNLEQLRKIVEQGESNILELKKSTAQLASALEAVCAFLNGEGGIALIGVDDKGKIIGQDVTDKTCQEIAKEINKLEPTPQIDTHYIHVQESKYVIAFEVKTGTHAPYLYDGRSYQRNQTTTARMSQHRYEQLLVKRGHLNHSWEEISTEDYTIDSLDHEEIRRAVRQGVDKERIPAEALTESIEDVLIRLKLLRNKKLINAAVILFAKDALPTYPQCLIKMARFKGQDKLGDFIDNQQIYGNAFKMLSEAEVFIRRHLPIASFFQPDSYERIDKPALPVLAIREALINAICHRSYSNRSSSISLAIYDNRLELWNNGTLPQELKIEDLKRKHESVLRNEIIAKIFHTRGFIERWGTGTNKMIELCKRDELPEPDFEEYSGGLAVIFKFKELIGLTGQVTTAKLSSLNTRQEEILQLLSSGKKLSADEIFNQLKEPPSLRTVKADLLTLKKLGFIEQQGKGRSTAWKAKS